MSLTVEALTFRFIKLIPEHASPQYIYLDRFHKIKPTVTKLKLRQHPLRMLLKG